MLGLVQLCILLYVKKLGSAVELKVIKKDLLEPLGITFPDQIGVTITRLVDRGLLRKVGVNDVKYVQSKKNDRLIEEALALVEFARKNR